MYKIINYIKNLILFNKRLTEEEKQQKKEGYSIEFIREGPESYAVYREGNRKVASGMSFTLSNIVRLYTDSFVKWDVPKGEILTPFEYQKVLNRLVRYFSCWGDVILDNSKLQDLEQLKELLQKQGIPFEDRNGVVVFSSTIEEERKNINSPFFSRKRF